MSWSESFSTSLIGGVLARVLACGTVFAVLPVACWADERPVLTVGKQGAQYATIQAAVDAAAEGATVRIGAGEYEGGIRIEKAVRLEGAGWERTTIVAPLPPADEIMRAGREMMQRFQRAKTPEEQSAIGQAFRDKYLPPAVRIAKAQGVELRGLKVTCRGLPLKDNYSPEAHVVVRGAKASIVGCAVLGSSGSGILVADGSQAEIRESLVAGLWWIGIKIGERDDRAKCRATIADCDVRNCHYAGIDVEKGQEALIERCWISGAAWHGIRYDDCSPRVVGNRIAGNNRCGIYASGKTAATVRQNLFLNNGMSCWFENRDTIAENTFARNGDCGLAVLGSSQPAVERNIFFGNKQGILCGWINDSRSSPETLGSPRLKQNLFWKTESPMVRQTADQLPGQEPEKVELAVETQSETYDPQFVDSSKEDFTLASGSPARRQKIGAADLLPATSRWPLQPEEKAIIPDGPTRNEREWKVPGKPAEKKPARSPDGATRAPQTVSMEEAFIDLYRVLGRQYPCFRLKGIDWEAVGQELLPRAKQVKSEAEFGLLCMELVARLEDSHAMVGRGAAVPPSPPMPRFDPGFACLIDDRGMPVVYYVDRGGPAEKAGVRPGMTLVSVNGKSAEEAMGNAMKQLSRYVGYSSERYLRYHAAQFLPRQTERNAAVRLELADVEGGKRSLELPASLDVRYLPRLPVPIPGIRDSANVAWKTLDGQIGYLYIRRIRADLIEQLDRAIGDLGKAKGLIIDVRGNSGGGFDFARSHRNFAPDDPEEPNRPRFAGPIAVLVDPRCISAGEGWTSWFVAKKRAKLFGEATAGASSRKRQYLLKNGLYTVTVPAKAYTGYLNRPIERRGLEPDVGVRQNARDLAAGRDTVLEAARQHLSEQVARP
jgi:parallel beta-helix repeat protein